MVINRHKLDPKRAWPYAVLTILVGAVVIIASLAAGTPIAFEPESGTLAAGATVTTVTGQSGTGAVKFASAAPTPTPGTQKNCATKPSDCGFPDATNTGWQPTGVTLTVVTGSQFNTFYIDTPGAVIDSKDIQACVFVRAPNVTIKRSKITCANQPMVKTYEPDGQGGLTDLAPGLVIEDTEFNGMNSEDSTGVAFNSYTLRRNNIHHIGSASRVGTNTVVEDNYVHDIAYTTDSHNGGFPSDGGTGITLRHNTVFMNSPNGYVVAVYNWVPAGNVVADVLVENNLLAGGNYIITCGAPGHIAPNLRVNGNRFSRLYYPNGGNFGPTANCTGASAWTNNVWDDSLSAVLP